MVNTTLQQKIQIHLIDLADDISRIKDEDKREEMTTLLNRLDDLNSDIRLENP